MHIDRVGVDDGSVCRSWQEGCQPVIFTGCHNHVTRSVAQHAACKPTIQNPGFVWKDIVDDEDYRDFPLFKPKRQEP